MTVFPIGHYGGARDSEHQVEHVVRIGWKQHRLTEDAFGVWVLAHGVAGTGRRPWTRDDVETRAARAGIAAADEILDDLLGNGVLAGVEDAETFARSYRMGTLYVGLGNAPDRPDAHAVGVPGIGAVALLDPDCYELWQWGGLAPTLWHSCLVRASVSTKLGDSHDPAAALDQILGDLRFLVSHGCAYVDVAVPQ